MPAVTPRSSAAAFSFSSTASAPAPGQTCVNPLETVFNPPAVTQRSSGFEQAFGLDSFQGLSSSPKPVTPASGRSVSSEPEKPDHFLHDVFSQHVEWKGDFKRPKLPSEVREEAAKLTQEARKLFERFGPAIEEAHNARASKRRLMIPQAEAKTARVVALRIEEKLRAAEKLLATLNSTRASS
jgi:hypothetical protein